jgi:hypothetical protein
MKHVSDKWLLCILYEEPVQIGKKQRIIWEKWSEQSISYKMFLLNN